MVNSRADKYRRGSRQQGAAMVEMAIVISLFLILIFGILEFTRAIFEWSRLVEATRAGARYAIVNDPACNIYNLAPDDPRYIKKSCPGGFDCSTNSEDETTVPVAGNCTIGGDEGVNDTGCRIVERMREIQPLINTPGANVNITYSCTEAGYVGLAKNVPAVKVEVENVKYSFIAAGLLGLYDPEEPEKWPITMPAFDTTRISEDLETID